MEKLTKQKIPINDMTQDELIKEIKFCQEMLNRYDYFSKLKLIRVNKATKIQNRLENCMKRLDKRNSGAIVLGIDR